MIGFPIVKNINTFNHVDYNFDIVKFLYGNNIPDHKVVNYLTV